MEPIINSHLIRVKPHLINCQLIGGTVRTMESNHAGTMSERIQDVLTAANDTPYQASEKLALIGASISPQAIYGWLKGGDAKPENLAAFAAVYKVSLPWLRFGQGERTEASLIGTQLERMLYDLTNEGAQLTLDFLEFQISRPNVQIAEETRASYIAFIEGVRADMAKKRTAG